MKHFLRFLLAIVMIVNWGGVVCGQTTETYTFSSFTSSKSVTLKGKNCTIVLGKGAQNNPAWNKNNKEARVYGGGSLTVSSTKLISKIVYNYKKNNDITITTTPEGFTNNTWQSSTGSNEIKATLSGTSGNLGFKSLEITYIDDPEPTEPTLTFGDYTNKIIEKHIGDADFTYKATLTPSVEGATITYTSDNEDVALVDDGYVVLGQTEGKATITATYENLTASYTINLTKLKTATTLSFGADYDNQTITKTIDDKEFTLPATLTPSIDGAEITYSSSNKSVAEVDNTGKVTLKAKTGTATITAEYAGNDTYAAATVAYNILVKNAKEEVVTFDFTGTNDYGSGVERTTDGNHYENADKTWTNNGVTLVTKGKYRWWDAKDAIRFHTGSSLTLNAPTNYHFTKIDLDGIKSFEPSYKETFTSGIWTGIANSVDFKYTGTKSDVNYITVTYEPDVALTTAASTFSTYAADYAVDYSAAGLEAYAIALDETNNKVSYTAINGTVKAETPVLVKGEASTTYSLAPSTADATDVTTALQISDGSIKAADNLYYGFATLNGVSGFKLVENGVVIPAKKGYLKLSSADNAKTFYAFDGEATGIEETFSKADSEKAFAPMYNISGQRVGEGYKGIVIVNGKKYMK